MNVVILQGRLTDDVKVEGKKIKYANFSVAVRDGVDEEGEAKAQFIRCVVFGKGAEIMEQFCVKGSSVCVRGRISNSSYEDEDGNKRFGTNVIVEDFDLIGSAKKEDDNKSKKYNGKYHK